MATLVDSLRQLAQAAAMHTPAQSWIDALGLQPHPEGGAYCETFRAPAAQSERSVGTAIYYLLRAGEASAWHKVDATEIWHFYAGDPLELWLWDGEGQAQRHVLGPDLAAGQRPQLVIPPHVWQSARPLGSYALCGCTVSPAFDFAGFVLDPTLQVPMPASADPDPHGRGPWQEDCALDACATRLAATAQLQPQYQWLACEQTVHGQVVFGAEHQGLPGFVHGGALSLLCDEAMGQACFLSGWIAPGAQVDVQFRAPARPGPAQLQARVVGRSGRRLFAEASVTQNGKTLVTARGLFVSVPPKDLTPFASWPGVARFAATP